MVSLGVRTSAAYLAVYVVGVVSGLLSVSESGLASSGQNAEDVATV